MLVYVISDGFANFQSIFIIFISFSVNNGPTQVQL